jgi:hypothetical protein
LRTSVRTEVDKSKKDVKPPSIVPPKPPIPKLTPAPPSAAPDWSKVNKDKVSIDDESKLPSVTGKSPRVDMGPSNAGLNKLVTASGALSTGDRASQYMHVGGNVDMNGLNPAVLKQFNSMVQEYGELTGNSVRVTSAYRTPEHQARLNKANPNSTGSKYGSLHVHGLALDVDYKDGKNLDEMDKLGLMRKYGFTRPVGGEPWHIEPAGIQSKLDAARDDHNYATQLTEASLYRGGGGYGSIRGTPMAHRDYVLAKKLWDAGGKTIDNTSGVKDLVAGAMDTVQGKVAENTPSDSSTISASSKPPSYPGLDTSQGSPIGGVSMASRGGYAGSVEATKPGGADMEGKADVLAGSGSPTSSSSDTSSISGAMNSSAYIPKKELDRGIHAMNVLMSKGWSKTAAAGILGNLTRESRLNPAVDVEGNGKGGGAGIAQWLKDRRAIVERAFGKKLINMSFDEQLAAVDWELRNTHKKAGSALKQSTSARDAAINFEKYYEVTKKSLQGGFHQNSIDFANKYASVPDSLLKGTTNPGMVSEVGKNEVAGPSKESASPTLGQIQESGKTKPMLPTGPKVDGPSPRLSDLVSDKSTAPSGGLSVPSVPEPPKPLMPVLNTPVTRPQDTGQGFSLTGVTEGLGHIGETLGQSLVVQKDILDTLKGILGNVNPANFNAIKDSLLQVANRSQSEPMKTGIVPGPAKPMPKSVVDIGIERDWT